MKIKTILFLGSMLLVSSISASETKNDFEAYLSSIKVQDAVRIANVKYNVKNGTNTYATGFGGFVKLNLPIYKENISFNIAPYFGNL